MQLQAERFEADENWAVIPGRALFARTRNPEPYAAAGFRGLHAEPVIGPRFRADPLARIPE
jgi:hypothetical protein